MDTPGLSESQQRKLLDYLILGQTMWGDGVRCGPGPLDLDVHPAHLLDLPCILTVPGTWSPLKKGQDTWHR